MVRITSAGSWLNPHLLLLAARILGLPDDATILRYLSGHDAKKPQVAIHDGILVLVMPLVAEKSVEFGVSAIAIREHLGVSKPQVSAVSAA